MKIQCSCGSKYSFDITPEMATQPIRFVCPSCGLDSSAAVNELIRRELGLAGLAQAPVPAPAPAVAAPAPASSTARVRVQSSLPPPPAEEETAQVERCAKHPAQVVAHHCMICQKPMCAKCMELFGYVCSPLCAGKAEAQGIHIPVFGGRKSVKEARQWRIVGRVTVLASVIAACLLGFWFWYAWFGSMPKPIFSVRFGEAAESGQSALCGTDQIMFLHGSTLARYDIAGQKEIWSVQMLDTNEIARKVLLTQRTMKATRDRWMREHPDADSDTFSSIPSAADLTERITAGEIESLRLHVAGQNVWVAASDSLVQYDFNNGKRMQEFPLVFGPDSLIARGNELLTLGAKRSGEFVVSHINLSGGDARVETFGEPINSAMPPLAGKKPRNAPGSRGGDLAGMPTTSGAASGKPLDPAKTAEQVQNLSTPARIALPAILATALHEQRVQKELDDPKPRSPSDMDLVPVGGYSLIPTDSGYLQFSQRLIEQRLVSHKAMREPSGKSVLDSGNLTVSQTTEAANEILNDMQRERGGDSVVEDESRYQVSVRRVDAKDSPEWKGEVIGTPGFLPLKTVSVVTGGHVAIVLNQANKELWRTKLDYKIEANPGSWSDPALYGEGPCVERDGALYIFDQAVLTAFDLKTGEVRWRLPSVGIQGLFFDGKGMMYVNTTDGSPDQLKFSRQIDVSQKPSDLVLKVDPLTGKTLWTSHEGGFVSYVSGKFLYMIDVYQAPEHKGPGPGRTITGLEKPSHVIIRRINPGTGVMMWEHSQPRAPLDVKFEKNSILLVFKKEVQVLRFISL